MNQQNIFTLLLITLLLANRQLAEDDDTNDDFSYTLINDLLILSMALSGFDNGNDKTTTF